MSLGNKNAEIKGIEDVNSMNREEVELFLRAMGFECINNEGDSTYVIVTRYNGSNDEVFASTHAIHNESRWTLRIIGRQIQTMLRNYSREQCIKLLQGEQ